MSDIKRILENSKSIAMIGVSIDLKKTSNIFTNFRKYCEKKLNVRASYNLNFSMPKNNLLQNDFKAPSLKDLGLDSFENDKALDIFLDELAKRYE